MTILSLFVLGFFAQAPQSPHSFQLDLQAELHAVVALNNGNGGGAFRVAKGPDWVLWQGAAGELERQGLPMTATANFEIASTSKAMTAAAVLTFVEQGVLDLDAPISTYLPPAYTNDLLVINSYNYGPELTLRQMLSNTSGLPDYWTDPPFVFPGFNAFLWDYSLAPQRFWTPEEILAYVPNLTPKFVPGTGWHYSDSGFLLAGLIMEQVSGRTLEQIYRERIYTPLGMQHTWLHWRETAPGNVLQSHRYEGSSDMYTKRHNSADWGGGGLVSTTRDLHRFLRGIADNTLFLNPATRDQMMQWVPTGTGQIQYGLGLYRVPLSFGIGWIWGHDGYGSSWMYYWSDQDVTFTGTLNQSNSDWWPLVMAAALEIDR